MDGMVNFGGVWLFNSLVGGCKVKSEEFWVWDKVFDLGLVCVINMWKWKMYRFNLDDDDNLIEILDNDGFFVFELICCWL